MGLEVSYTPALARLSGPEGADAASYQKAETHLAETGGITVAARQIQRVAQRVGESAQGWQAREFQPQQGEPCQQIVDFYHALEHAGQVLEALLGSNQHPTYQNRHHRWAKRLLKDGVAALLAQTRREAAAAGRGETVEQELGYFVRNIARMQYGTVRQQGLFIGSGVIEAGCQSIIGARCKQSDMFWSRGGPRTSSPSAASMPAVDSTNSGNTVSANTPHAMTPCRWLPGRRILSCARRRLCQESRVDPMTNPENTVKSQELTP